MVSGVCERADRRGPRALRVCGKRGEVTALGSLERSAASAAVGLATAGVGKTTAGNRLLTLFQSLMDGEHCLRGFANRDIRARLQSPLTSQAGGHDTRKQSAKVSRIFRRCHAHGLIAKIPHTRRWRVTGYGREVMGASLYLREHHFPSDYTKIAA